MHDYPESCRIVAKKRIVQTSLRIFRFGPVVPEKIQILNLTFNVGDAINTISFGLYYLLDFKLIKKPIH